MTTFTDIDLKPNSNQLGTAIVAAYCLTRFTRQFWIIPSGMGKTRFLASTIAIMHKKLDDGAKVYIVFPNGYPNLLARDKVHYERLSSVL